MPISEADFLATFYFLESRALGNYFYFQESNAHLFLRTLTAAPEYQT